MTDNENAGRTFGDISNNRGNIAIGSNNTQSITNLANSGNTELANALVGLRQAINASKELSPQEKKRNLKDIDAIADEADSDQPDKTWLERTWSGVVAAVSKVGDLADAVGKFVPIITLALGIK